MHKRVLPVLFCLLTVQGCSEVSTKFSNSLEGTTETNNPASIATPDIENAQSPNSLESPDEKVSLTIDGKSMIQPLKIGEQAEEVEEVKFSSQAQPPEASRYEVFNNQEVFDETSHTISDLTESFR